MKVIDEAQKRFVYEIHQRGLPPRFEKAPRSELCSPSQQEEQFMKMLDEAQKPQTRKPI